jgi:hypothetical protein
MAILGNIPQSPSSSISWSNSFGLQSNLNVHRICPSEEHGLITKTFRNLNILWARGPGQMPLLPPPPNDRPQRRLIACRTTRRLWITDRVCALLACKQSALTSDWETGTPAKSLFVYFWMSIVWEMSRDNKQVTWQQTRVDPLISGRDTNFVHMKANVTWTNARQHIKSRLSHHDTIWLVGLYILMVMKAASSSETSVNSYHTTRR